MRVYKTVLVIATIFGTIRGATSQAANAQPLDTTAAKAAFAEAQTVSAHDAGRLWGQPLYGPMMFVDPQSRRIVANEPDGQGRLKPQDGVFVGTLEPARFAADTAFDWAGKRWTMLMWPQSDDTVFRQTTLAHEMFHRIQPQYGLMVPSQPCPHLETREGRIWMQLEWRALAKALTTTGATHEGAIADALAFRARRHGLFAEAADCERRLDLAEGTAEYTGLSVGISARTIAAQRMAKQLTEAGALQSFVRFYPYLSGPAYGFLLDEKRPGWNRALTETSDMAALLAKTTAFDPGLADVHGAEYGADALRAAETARAEKRATMLADYRKRLVEGPTLVLSNAGAFNIGFRPGTEVSLENFGMVYPTLHASDVWGVLNVTDGALLAPNFAAVTVGAPSEGQKEPTLSEPGWSLTLNPGWHVVQTAPNRFALRKD